MIIITLKKCGQHAARAGLEFWSFLFEIDTNLIVCDMELYFYSTKKISSKKIEFCQNPACSKTNSIEFFFRFSFSNVIKNSTDFLFSGVKKKQVHLLKPVQLWLVENRFYYCHWTLDDTNVDCVLMSSWIFYHSHMIE